MYTLKWLRFPTNVSTVQLNCARPLRDVYLFCSVTAFTGDEWAQQMWGWWEAAARSAGFLGKGVGSGWLAHQALHVLGKQCGMGGGMHFAGRWPGLNHLPTHQKCYYGLIEL